jgi:hypothetical protein
MRFIAPLDEVGTPEKSDSTYTMPSGSRIMELASVAGTAMSALMVCSPLLLAARPKTPLRVFCIAAFEFFARLEGRTLGRQRRQAIAHACDFGSLRDDYYDHRILDAVEYRSLRCRLRQVAPRDATTRYTRELREAERSRPMLTAGNSEIARAVIAYRTRVLDLSLRWLHAISGLKIESVRFHVLLSLVGLMQLADDLLDWKDDQAAKRPSYVTASLLARPRSAVAVPLRAQADAWLQRMIGAARQEAAAVPLAIAGVVTWTFVTALLRLRFPR